ncbi:recombination mediator RecR [Salibacteraceae bacterium]|jgi:recombination protein RecR|nr:recombination protein RecR [Crocinitomicaceae bacterium]MCH9823493.1 recombination mediator RecR [Bacteroidota bacterium]MDB0058071.1 recombination mediator RecR [Salibacteraceae bacterium]MDB9725625.1 recombination mediator RecR [Salibacteraceae bacterium]MDC1204020.1 recombination mediator RecR [Salibacteraceae bacterium]|tara:strand:+ start:436 stop:1053 length:618 start_codon:yes stop_codon:yes gene_type:complete
MELPSKYLQEAVEAIASLPGIGRKSALRLTLHLLRRDTLEVSQFTHAISSMKENVRFCETCGNISDGAKCNICAQAKRDQSVICVVEDLRDVLAIESTQLYQGLYHVLGGIISPMDGIGPSDLNISSLFSRVESGEVSEIILALNATMEGDTTSFYLYKKLEAFECKVTSIARGVSIGDELQYTDEITLGRSIQHRTPFEQTLSR